MITYKKINLIFLIFFIFFESTALAATKGEPSVYLITVKKIEISKDGGLTYFTVGSGSRDFTINSSNAHGAMINDYVSGIKPADGIYDAIRLTMSNAITLSGRIRQLEGFSAGTYFCTGGDTGLACDPTPVTTNLTNALVAAAGLTLPSGMTINDAASEIILIDRTNKIDVSSSKQIAYKISYDTSQALIIQSDDTIHPGIPSISISQK